MSFPKPDTQVLAEIEDLGEKVKEELKFRTDLEHAKAVIARRGILATIVSSEEGAECARTVIYDAFKAVLGEAVFSRIEAKAGEVFTHCEMEVEKRIREIAAELERLRTCGCEKLPEEADSVREIG